jgi:hypothetical protein
MHPIYKMATETLCSPSVSNGFEIQASVAKEA